MTTSTSMFMETVSLNDDAPSGPAPSPSPALTGAAGDGGGAVLDVDSLEAQFAPPAAVKLAADAENGHAQATDQVVVVVGSDAGANGNDDRRSNESVEVVKNTPVLPNLRVPPLKAQLAEERDYVDPTLFSPEVSRHAMEVAHRRAKAIALEVKELMELEGDPPAPPSAGARLSPLEAVGIIGGAFLSSFSRVKQIVKSSDTEYDLLAGSSPLSKMEDLDTDGDGLQISPDASKGDGQHFQSPLRRPALKRISAYSAIPTDKPLRPKKSLQWHDDVLDGDEEFVDEAEEDELDGSGGESSPRETNSLVLGGNSILHYNKGGNLTPRSKKKRKKLVKTMMRRLTPREKEELYRQRPDLMIVPNWAQKYREEIAGEETTRSSLWLVMFITLLAVLLIVLIFLIERQHARNKQ